MKSFIISSKQLFALIFLFELGSAVVVGLGMKAKQDAWLAILLGLICGLMLFILYFYLYFRNSKLSLTSFTMNLLGKYLGGLVSLIYILYFGYIAARVLRDFGELVVTSVLYGTPLIAVNFIIVIITVYACYLGIEVIGRTGEILFMVLMLLGTLLIISVFAAGLPKIENLLPILENGWRPVLTTVFPLTLTFPFGETVVFTMIFPNLNNPKLIIKSGFFSMLFSGLILATVIAINISVLGVTTAASSNFPLLETLKKVNIGAFINRLDPIAILILIIGGFIKITILTYAAVTGLADIFKIKNYKKIIIPVCGVILISSLKIASSFTEHIEIGLEKVPKYMHIPLQVLTPLLLGIITFLKHRKSCKKV